MSNKQRAVLLLCAAMVVGIMLAALLFAGAMKLQQQEPVNEAFVKMLLDLSKASATLGIGAGLGTIVSASVQALFSERERMRHQRDDQRIFLFNTLEQLKAANDTVESARIFVLSHRSGKTYTEQIKRMPDVLASLQSVKRALDTDPRAKTLDAKLIHHIDNCKGFIEGMLEEYIKAYSTVAQKQEQHEKNKKSGGAAGYSNALETITYFGPINMEAARISEPDRDSEIGRFYEEIKSASKVLRDALEKLR